jgi:hypothetical protein
MDDKKDKTDDKQDKTSTKWTAANEATLIHTLSDEKTKGNWGDNNPKKVAYTACERALADSEKRSGGVPKSFTTIKNRWQRVRPLFQTICTTNKHTQFKQEYDVVKELRGLSGFGWDPCLCTVTAERDVWDAYIKVSTIQLQVSRGTHAYIYRI